MICEGRKYVGYQTYKTRGKQEYSLVHPWESNERYCSCPLSIGVTTEDLEKQHTGYWSEPLGLITTGVGGGWLYDHAYEVSWAKTPEPWKIEFLCEMMKHHIIHPKGAKFTKIFLSVPRVPIAAYTAVWLAAAEEALGRDMPKAKRILRALCGYARHDMVFMDKIKAMQNIYLLPEKMALKPERRQLEYARQVAGDGTEISLELLFAATKSPIVQAYCLEQLIAIDPVIYGNVGAW